MIAIDSILHFIIDGICAYAMFGRFGNEGAEAFLFYNLCAFALQMPLGAMVDLIASKLPGNTIIPRRRFYWAVTILGVLFTIIGMFSGVVALGVGNALFHVGGGVNTLSEDFDKKYNGRGLGVFVAPGALGLFVGKIFSQFPSFVVYIRNFWIGIALILVLLGFLRLYYEEKHLIFVMDDKEEISAPGKKENELAKILLTALVCFAVVIIRSYVGLAISFEWKTGFWLPFISVMAVVLGKIAGGFLAAKIGELKAVIISLSLAAVGFALMRFPVFGIAALFFFNMSMPITLYMLAKKMQELKGFAFGLLTFGLFVGYFLVWAGLIFESSYQKWVGVFGSIISMLLLLSVLISKKAGKK